MGKQKKFTDSAVAGMMTNPVMFMDKLRIAAKERGFTGPSVSEFVVVLRYLETVVHAQKE